MHEFAGDGILTGSDVTVRVYISDELVGTIHVPTVGVCGENYYWYVGDVAIDAGTWTRTLVMSATPPFVYMAAGK